MNIGRTAWCCRVSWGLDHERREALLSGITKVVIIILKITSKEYETDMDSYILIDVIINLFLPHNWSALNHKLACSTALVL